MAKSKFKIIEIICDDCNCIFLAKVAKDYEFNYEDFTCPECDTYENLNEY